MRSLDCNVQAIELVALYNLNPCLSHHLSIRELPYLLVMRMITLRALWSITLHIYTFRHRFTATEAVLYKSVPLRAGRSIEPRPYLPRASLER